jgi:hypothetical protein
VGVYLPLEGGKGYHVDLEASATDPRIPVWLHESWAIATPLPGRLRLAGTLELAGPTSRSTACERTPSGEAASAVCADWKAGG